MRKVICIVLFLLNHFLSDAQITLPNLQPLQYIYSGFGNALNFDGTATYALCQYYTKDPVVDFTLEFWINNTGADGSNDRIYGSYLNNALHIAKSTTQLKLLATDLGGPSTWQTVCTLESNTWVHIAIVRSTTSLKVYKNAILVQTYTVDAVSTLPSYFRLGSNANSNGENGNFSIDELRIWKTDISRALIQKYMYTTLNPNSTADQNPYAKLVLYYRFDQGEAGLNNTNELGLFNFANSN